MPRQKTLPPGAGISKERSAKGSTFYRARLSPAFLGKGSKKKAFPTRSEAEAWIFEEEKNLGTRKLDEPVAERWEIPLETMAEVKVALALLNGRPSLLKAVEAWVAALESTKETKTMAEAIEALHEEQEAEALTKRHLRETKSKLKLYWADFLSKKVDEITPEDVSSMLKRPAGKNASGERPSLSLRTKRKRYSRILINFCIDQQWIKLDRNPLGVVRRKKRNATDPAKAEIYVLSPLEVARLLWSAQEHRPEALGGLILKVFSGMRNPEMTSVRWGAIADGSIFLKAAFVKTNRSRTVTVEPVLAEWLKLVGAKKNPGDLVFDYLPKSKDREAAWQLALREIAANARFASWPQNALRHCFSSYHFALYKDAARTATEAGNSEAVIKANYLNAVRPSDCKQFWCLYPGVAEALAQTPVDQKHEPEMEEEPEPPPDDLPIEEEPASDDIKSDES